MGQYFEAACLDKMEVVNPRDYDETAKLTETAWVGNDYVGAVEKLLSPRGTWHGCRIVWAGDYMDSDKFMDEFETELASKDENGNSVEGLYHYADEFFTHVKTTPKSKRGKGYLLNLDKNLYVDIAGCPQNKSGYRYNPLPILTCASNGQGGGDYYSEDGKEYVGTWCGDHLCIMNKIPEGFTEVKPDFFEEF